MSTIMLKMKDNRKFATHAKYRDSMIEFAKSFNAEVFEIELIEGKVFELKKLANAFCDPDYQSEIVFNKSKKIFPLPKRPRDEILKDAQSIREFIEKKMRSGKPLSLKDLKQKYSNQKMTDACLCNHFSQVRKSLKTEGFQIEKVGAGKYCLN